MQTEQKLFLSRGSARNLIRLSLHRYFFSNIVRQLCSTLFEEISINLYHIFALSVENYSFTLEYKGCWSIIIIIIVNWQIGKMVLIRPSIHTSFWTVTTELCEDWIFVFDFGIGWDELKLMLWAMRDTFYIPGHSNDWYLF